MPFVGNAIFVEHFVFVVCVRACVLRLREIEAANEEELASIQVVCIGGRFAWVRSSVEALSKASSSFRRSRSCAISVELVAIFFFGGQERGAVKLHL